MWSPRARIAVLRGLLLQELKKLSDQTEVIPVVDASAVFDSLRDPERAPL